MIKLVAFDWNGTIIADTLAAYECSKQVLKLLNIKPVSLTTYREHFNVPVRNYYSTLGASKKELKDKAQQISRTFNSCYELRVAKVRTRANIKKLLDWLTANKINLVIFSNHTIQPIKKQLRRLKIERYFSEILANSHSGTVFKTRGKKEKLQQYIKHNKLASSEVLIIGDMVEEIDITRELGVKVVSITNGYCSTTRLKAAKPDYLINDLNEVSGIVSELNEF